MKYILAGMVMGAALMANPPTYAKGCDYIPAYPNFRICISDLQGYLTKVHSILKIPNDGHITLGEFLKKGEMLRSQGKRWIPNEIAQKIFPFFDSNGDCVISRVDDYNDDNMISNKDYNYFYNHFNKKKGTCSIQTPTPMM